MPETRSYLYKGLSPVASTAVGDNGGMRSEAYGHDALGSVTEVVQYGMLQASYRYDAFGKTYEGALSSGERGYNGKPYNAVTGHYNYGYRDYDPMTGRFATVDPIRDGMNWYVYTANDPVNHIDPWGLATEDVGDSDEKNIFRRKIDALSDWRTAKNDEETLPQVYDEEVGTTVPGFMNAFHNPKENIKVIYKDGFFSSREAIYNKETGKLVEGSGTYNIISPAVPSEKWALMAAPVVGKVYTAYVATTWIGHAVVDMAPSFFEDH